MAYLGIRRRLDTEEMNRGIWMLEAGLSQRHVAGVLGCTRTPLQGRGNGNVKHRQGVGRERVTT